MQLLGDSRSPASSTSTSAETSPSPGPARRRPTSSESTRRAPRSPRWPGPASRRHRVREPLLGPDHELVDSSRSSTGIPRNAQIENRGTSWPSCGALRLRRPAGPRPASSVYPVAARRTSDTWRARTPVPPGAHRAWRRRPGVERQGPPSPKRPVGHPEPVQRVTPRVTRSGRDDASSTSAADNRISSAECVRATEYCRRAASSAG